MKWIVDATDTRRQSFVMEHGLSCGFYLYIFEGEDCTHDYLQDSLDIAMEFVKARYGIDKNEWKLQRQQ